ncbi:hypothetical protein D3C77_528710 [compost metagenome]
MPIALKWPFILADFAVITAATVGSCEKPGARISPGITRNNGNTFLINSNPVATPLLSVPPIISTAATTPGSSTSYSTLTESDGVIAPPDITEITAFPTSLNVSA